MGSNKPKTIKVSKPVREVARMIFTTWAETIKEYRGDEYAPTIPNALKSDTQPLNKDSLEARICGWIEQNAESYIQPQILRTPKLIDDCFVKWEQLLSLVKDGDRFMHKGYGCVPPPTLAWLFSFNRKREEYGINCVLNQQFDWVFVFRSSDQDVI